MAQFRVWRRVTRIEHGTLEAASRQQAADMLNAGLWGDCVEQEYERDDEHAQYKVDGVSVTTVNSHTHQEK